MSNCDKDSTPLGLRVVPQGEAEAPAAAGCCWTVDEVAAFLKVSRAWVWKQVRARKGFPFISMGGRNYRFNPEKVKAWLAAQEQGFRAGED